MRIWLLIAVCLAACSAPLPAPPAAPQRLRADGTRFVTTTGTPFSWRGVTAFRLLEFVAHGREAEAAAYLDWAAKQRLTIVRVFVTAHHLFQLTPADGLKALPRLLELAAARGLYVEVVALADTLDRPLDLDAHVKAVGAIAAGHTNAIVEIANEPWHPTQDKRLHDPVFVKKLAGLVPAGVPVALGSAEADPGYADGQFVTWHSPRSSGDGGWRHVTDVARGAELLGKWRKPVISDEPIGAHTGAIPGRRDNDPRRFGAAAALTRLAGLGATFHYEGGLQAKLPGGREQEAFDAWSAGLDLLQALPEGGQFIGGAELPRVIGVRNVRAAFARVFDNEAWVVAVDPGADAAVTWTAGWRARDERRAPGVIVYRATR